MEAPTVTEDRVAFHLFPAVYGSLSTSSRPGFRRYISDTYSSVFNQMPIPVSFRCLEVGSEGVEYATKAVDLFPNGLVMSSPRKLRAGGLLSFRMRVPLENPAGTLLETCCTASVILEQKLKDGTVGYKVEIEAGLPA